LIVPPPDDELPDDEELPPEPELLEFDDPQAATAIAAATAVNTPTADLVLPVFKEGDFIKSSSNRRRMEPERHHAAIASLPR
jgi:hypothetical protein